MDRVGRVVGSNTGWIVLAAINQRARIYIYIYIIYHIVAEALKPAFANTSKELLPDAGCERPNPARVPASGGSGALQQQVSTALASGTKVTFNNLLAYLNTTLGLLEFQSCPVVLFPIFLRRCGFSGFDKPQAKL